MKEQIFTINNNFKIILLLMKRDFSLVGLKRDTTIKRYNYSKKIILYFLYI